MNQGGKDKLQILARAKSRQALGAPSAGSGVVPQKDDWERARHTNGEVLSQLTETLQRKGSR